MSYVVFHKGTSGELANIPVEEGNVLFDNTQKKIFVDEEDERVQYGGAIDVDDELDEDSVNPVQNGVITSNLQSKQTEINNIKNRLKSNNIEFKFGVDEDGNYGYYKAGADTVTPFKEYDGLNIVRTFMPFSHSVFYSPTNSSGATSSSVGILGQNKYYPCANSTYFYNRRIYFSLTPKTMQEIKQRLDKGLIIKRFYTILYATDAPETTTPSETHPFRFANGSNYWYLTSINLSEFVSSINYNTLNDGYITLYGRPSISKQATDYSPSMNIIKLDFTKEVRQLEINIDGWSTKYKDLFFSIYNYYGCELSIEF